MKRFSWLAFVGVTLAHVYITGELITAGIRASKSPDPEPRSVWLSVWSWIIQPILMLLQPVGADLDNSYRAVIAVMWSLCLGVCLGFLVPRLFRWRHQDA